MTRIQTEQITLPGIFVNLLIDTVAHWGITADELLAGSSISHLRLKDPFWQIDYQTLTMLGLRAVQLTGEPGLAFYSGMQVKISTYGLLGFTIMVAKDLRQAFDLTQQFVPLQATGVNVRLELQNNIASVYIEIDWLDRQVWLHRRLYELAVAGGIIAIPNVVEAICGKSVQLDFDIEIEKPDYFQRFEHLFKGEVNYSQPHLRVTFDASYFDFPCLMADPLLEKVMRENCEKELKTLIGNHGVASQLRWLIQTDVVHFNTVERAARQMHLSPRSLQRKLNEEGQGFKEIYDDIFKRKATQLLRESSLSVQQIAEQLGYGSASSFIRAYKRVTGETPRQHFS